MWFNTAACDHPVTLPAPEPLQPPRGPNQSHQTQGEQGLWGRASPGAALGLYTNTSLARSSVPSTLQGQDDAHPVGSSMETFKKQKMLYPAPVRPLWRLEGAVGPAQHGGEGGALPSGLQGLCSRVSRQHGSGCNQRRKDTSAARNANMNQGPAVWAG